MNNKDGSSYGPWEQQTIQMVDALLTHGRLLRDRLQAEYERLNKLPDDEWNRLSPEVQEAIMDLRHSDVFTDLLHPRDNRAMAIIHSAAELLDAETVDSAGLRDQPKTKA